MAVETASTGEVVVAGYTSPVPFAVGPEYSAFVATFDVDGTQQDVFVYPTRGGGEIARDLTVRSDGSVHAVGETSYGFGEVEYGFTDRTSVDAFLTLHTRAGEVVWIKQFGKLSSYSGRGVDVDSSGAVVVVGRGNGDFGGEPLGLSDVFLAKFDASGRRLWAERFGTPEFDAAFGVEIGAGDVIYLAGVLARRWRGLEGSVVFLAAYSREGEQIWLETFEH